MRGTTRARLFSLAAASAVFVAACGGGAATPTATTPPKPTAAPTAAAKPTAKPAASPAAKPAASPAAAPAPSPAASALTGTITIVSSLPRTGAAKTATDSMVKAFKMAFTEANNKVGGATLKYEDMDDATAAKGSWDAAQEASNANTALNDPDVMYYLGTYNSGAAAVSIPILCRGNLAMTSPANTYPGLTKKLPAGIEANEPDVYYPGCKRNYTRVVPSDELQGAVAAKWAQDLGAKKVYILDDADLYGHGIAVFFKSNADKLGLQVLGGPEGYDPSASDYRALAQKIRATNPDLVYVGTVTEHNAGKLWQDLRSTLGNNVKLMGPDGIYNQGFLDSAGPAAENTYITFGGVPPSKLTGKGAEWYQSYKKQFNEEPDAYAAYSYESAKVALDAIQRAGKKDRAAIRDAVFATRNFAGVLGTWSFTDTGDTTLRTMSGRQVKGGKFDDANAILIQAPS